MIPQTRRGCPDVLVRSDATSGSVHWRVVCTPHSVCIWALLHLPLQLVQYFYSSQEVGSKGRMILVHHNVAIWLQAVLLHEQLTLTAVTQRGATMRLAAMQQAIAASGCISPKWKKACLVYVTAVMRQLCLTSVKHAPPCACAARQQPFECTVCLASHLQTGIYNISSTRTRSVTRVQRSVARGARACPARARFQVCRTWQHQSGYQGLSNLRPFTPCAEASKLRPSSMH